MERTEEEEIEAKFKDKFDDQKNLCDVGDTILSE
jgi:hypothetical protein